MSSRRWKASSPLIASVRARMSSAVSSLKRDIFCVKSEGHGALKWWRTYYRCFALSNSSSASIFCSSFLPCLNFSAFPYADSYADLNRGEGVISPAVVFQSPKHTTTYLRLSSFFFRCSKSLILSPKPCKDVMKVSLKVTAYASCKVATLQCARPNFTRDAPILGSEKRIEKRSKILSGRK